MHRSRLDASTLGVVKDLGEVVAPDDVATIGEGGTLLPARIAARIQSERHHGHTIHQQAPDAKVALALHCNIRKGRVDDQDRGGDSQRCWLRVYACTHKAPASSVSNTHTDNVFPSNTFSTPSSKSPARTVRIQFSSILTLRLLTGVCELREV